MTAILVAIVNSIFKKLLQVQNVNKHFSRYGKQALFHLLSSLLKTPFAKTNKRKKEQMNHQFIRCLSHKFYKYNTTFQFCLLK